MKSSFIHLITLILKDYTHWQPNQMQPHQTHKSYISNSLLKNKQQQQRYVRLNDDSNLLDHIMQKTAFLSWTDLLQILLCDLGQITDLLCIYVQ